ncbi:MAG: SH3 domain-containing protein [Sandaracinaceae bacterium]
MLRFAAPLGALLLLTGPRLVSAQDALPEADWRPAVTRGMAAFEAQDWAWAAHSLGQAFDRLAAWDRSERFAIACELAVSRARTGDLELARRRLADGLTSNEAGRRAACLGMMADVLTERGDAEEASHLLLMSLDLLDAPARRAAYGRLPEAVRRTTEADRARLATQPLGVFVGVAPDAHALAASLARWVPRSRPTRSAQCSAIETWNGGALGLVQCSYADAPEPFHFGARSYPLESFLWVRVPGGVRVRAAFAAGHGYDCETGHDVNHLRPERLTGRRHGVDGWLLRVTERWELSAGDYGGDDTRTYAYACTAASGACARVEESRQRCMLARSGRRGRCDGYRGQAWVRRGQLTIRVDAGALPEALQRPVALASLVPPRPASMARTPRPRVGCDVVVVDPSPPLNVRAQPSGRAAVVGTLADGASVRPASGPQNNWVPIEAPVAGWVSARLLQRRCAPHLQR